MKENYEKITKENSRKKLGMKKKHDKNIKSEKKFENFQRLNVNLYFFKPKINKSLKNVQRCTKVAPKMPRITSSSETPSSTQSNFRSQKQ